MTVSLHTGQHKDAPGTSALALDDTDARFGALWVASRASAMRFARFVCGAGSGGITSSSQLVRPAAEVLTAAWEGVAALAAAAPALGLGLGLGPATPVPASTVRFAHA